MKILITCGPTWVAIDDVRVISNQSSGQMGHLIAQEFVRKGDKVTVLQGPVTHQADLKGIKLLQYQYYNELEKALKNECKKKYDIIIHAAAVSDYTIAKPFKGKLDSSTHLTLQLKATPKLINDIKTIAPNSFLVGFKLEPKIIQSNLKKLTQKLFIDAGCDVVVGNQNGATYKGYVVDADGNILAQSNNKQSLAKNLVRILS